MKLIKVLLSKIDNFLMSKPVITIFLMSCIILGVSGILIKFGINISIFENVKLLGMSISNNLALLWLAYLIFISIKNLKKCNQKRDN